MTIRRGHRGLGRSDHLVKVVHCRQHDMQEGRLGRINIEDGYEEDGL